jgi:hypothetical protein
LSRSGIQFYDIESKQKINNLTIVFSDEFLADFKGTSEFCYVGDSHLLLPAQKSEGTKALVWKIGSNEPVLAIRDNATNTEVTTAEFLNNPERVAVAMYNTETEASRVDFWNIALKEKYATLGGFTKRIGQLAVSPDGRSLAVTDSTATPVVVSTDTVNPIADACLRKVTRTYGSTFLPRVKEWKHITFDEVSNNGQVAVSLIDNVLTVQLCKTGEVISRIVVPNQAQRIIVSPDGSRFALVYKNSSEQETANWDDFHLDIWKTNKTQKETTISGRNVHFSPDGEKYFQKRDRNGHLVISSLTKDDIPIIISGISGQISWSESGSIIVGFSNEAIVLYDIKSGKKLSAFSPDIPDDDYAKFIVVNEASKLAVYVTRLGLIGVFGIESGFEVGKGSQALRGSVVSLCINAKGSRVLVQFENGILGLYDVSTKQELIQMTRVLNNYQRVFQASLGFSSDDAEIFAARFIRRSNDDATKGNLFEVLHWDVKPDN